MDALRGPKDRVGLRGPLRQGGTRRGSRDRVGLWGDPETGQDSGVRILTGTPHPDPGKSRSCDPGHDLGGLPKGWQGQMAAPRASPHVARSGSLWTPARGGRTALWGCSREHPLLAIRCGTGGPRSCDLDKCQLPRPVTSCGNSDWQCQWTGEELPQLRSKNQPVSELRNHLTCCTLGP